MRGSTLHFAWRALRFALVRLSYQEKQDLYHQLGQLVRSGIAVPAALRTLANAATGRVRGLLQQVQKEIEKGQSVAGAFSRQTGAVTPMERSVIEACERSGRFDQGCQRLSTYFAALASARRVVIRKSLYPLFTLHFGILMLGLPRFFVGPGAGVGAYLEHTLGVLLLFYGVAAIVWISFRNFSRLAVTSVAADRFYRAIPVIGKIHSWFALARFCATYEMQLNSAVNVVESLFSAWSVSQSAAIRATVEAIIPEVRLGAQVGPLLSRSGVFPSEMMRAFRVGEETGKLDEELRQMAEGFEEKALDRVASLAEWLPKLIYAAIAVYLAFEIVDSYRTVLAGYGKILDGE